MRPRLNTDDDTIKGNCTRSKQDFYTLEAPTADQLCNGYWDNNQNPGVCTPCSDQCESCSFEWIQPASVATGGDKVCWDCVGGAIFHTGLQDCQSQCFDPYNYTAISTLPGPNAQQQNSCFLACPEGMSPDSTKKCLPCQLTNCDTCVIVGSSPSCTSCASDFLYNGECITTCPQGTGKNAVTNVCDTCATG